MNRIYETAKKPKMHKYRDGQRQDKLSFNFTDIFYGEKYDYQWGN